MSVQRPIVLTGTIADGQSLSGAIEIGSSIPVGILVGAITSAALTFQGSADGTTYYDVYDASGSEVTVPASTGSRAFAAPAALAGFNFIKVRSGTTGSPVNQAGGDTVTVVCK